MLLRTAVFACVATCLSSCAVYDPQRGVFVSSSVTTVRIEPLEPGRKIVVLPFMFESESQALAQHTTFMVDGAFIPMSHTYVFDEVDRHNLRESVVQSLKAAGADVVDVPNGPGDATATGEVRLSASFEQIGMASGALGSFKCILAGKISVASESKTKSRNVHVVGTSMGSVSGAKNDAIKQFIDSAAQVLADSN